MGTSDKEVAPQVRQHPGTRSTERMQTVDTKNSTATVSLPSTEERPCACYGGVVFIGHLVEEDGEAEPVEVVEAVPCRRCNAGKAR